MNEMLFFPSGPFLSVFAIAQLVVGMGLCDLKEFLTFGFDLSGLNGMDWGNVL